MNKDMTLEEVDVVLKTTKRQEKPEVRWPEQFKEEIKRAIDHEEDIVYLGNKWFNITYRGESFHLKPMEGFVPTGWFPRKWVNSAD